MTPTHRTRTLFKSDLLHIIDYRCSGQDGRVPQEEYAAAHEIILPRCGAYRARSSAGDFLVDPNQALFFNRGQEYQVSHPLPGGDRSTVFILRPDVLIELLSALRPGVEAHPDHPFACSHAIPRSRLRLALYWLFPPEGSPKPNSLQVEESLILLLGELLSGQDRCGESPNGVSPTNTRLAAEELAERVKLVLGWRFRETIRLDEIARAVYVSPFHLCRSFKRAAGLPIHSYLTRLRLHQSLEDLVDRPGVPLSIIALDLGFASHNHFTAAFHTGFGLTPSEFRQIASGSQARQLRNYLKA